MDPVFHFDFMAVFSAIISGVVLYMLGRKHGFEKGTALMLQEAKLAKEAAETKIVQTSQDILSSR